ncbi:MAG: DUF1778 domain-containing protein [SAR324 cluster bacterium]|uniref:DUF1778 domain-containing protein n=1 Tax=SAR324 cluster bacterium TaxID=2024889 RepID=A0A7X9FSY9_9DELT|nr:DUF1778 domain-containing protein [SAR324 cluster bacterium]
MFGPKIKVSKDLYDKLKRAADLAGCSSLEEFIEGILDREAQRVITQSGKDKVTDKEVEAIANKLKGLGYLE